jgi:hypothetical protein
VADSVAPGLDSSSADVPGQSSGDGVIRQGVGTYMTDIAPDVPLTPLSVSDPVPPTHLAGIPAGADRGRRCSGADEIPHSDHDPFGRCGR